MLADLGSCHIVEHELVGRNLQEALFKVFVDAVHARDGRKELRTGQQ